MMNQANQSEQQLLISSLLNIDCLKLGQFTLKSGLKSDYYINLRGLCRSVEAKNRVANAFITTIKQIYDDAKITQDRIAIIGVPNGATEIAAVVADRLNLGSHSMRKEIKGYGDNQKDDCDKFFPNRTYIMIEDTMSTGSSIVETLQKIPDHNITDIIVIVDRQQGGREKLAREFPSIRFHALLTASQILQFAEQSKQQSVF